MKKLMIISVLVITSFTYKAADAQVSISINIGSQPEWGPSGYDHAEYYYIPDIDVYYHIADRTYTYYEGNRWITGKALPSRYSHYDLYKGYKVVINEAGPWLNAGVNRSRYAKFKGSTNQRNIRDSRNSRYVNNNSDKGNNRPVLRRGNDSRGNDNGRRQQTSRPQRKS